MTKSVTNLGTPIDIAESVIEASGFRIIYPGEDEGGSDPLIFVMRTDICDLGARVVSINDRNIVQLSVELIKGRISSILYPGILEIINNLQTVPGVSYIFSPRDPDIEEDYDQVTIHIAQFLDPEGYISDGTFAQMLDHMEETVSTVLPVFLAYALQRPESVSGDGSTVVRLSTTVETCLGLARFGLYGRA